MNITNMTEAQAVAETKARSQRVKIALPEAMLKGNKRRQTHSKGLKGSGQDTEARAKLEATYNQLDGEWREWLEVARKYENRIPQQDQLDVRHDIIIRLATVRERSGEPIPIYKAYRVASYTVADYYRGKAKLSTGLDCKHCPTSKRRECVRHSLYSQCPKLRRTLSLNAEYVGANGDTYSILDTVADDTAIDLDQWLDAGTWLRGCPVRLVTIAVKLAKGESLDGKDRKYLWKYRKHTQKPLL